MHFCDAFEADERVMETLVILLTSLRYRGRELIWSCVINKALGASWQLSDTDSVKY